MADDARRKAGASKEGWEAGEMTRRDWLKVGLAAGAVGGAAALGAAFGGALFTSGPGVVEANALIYTRFPEPQWWNAMANRPVRVTDFEIWQGATAVWQGSFPKGQLMPGTGLPVLVIRVARDETVFQSPPTADLGLPSGYSLFYDDASRGIRIVVLYDRCVHLCCYPGWQVVTNPPPGRDYVAPCPTYQVYGIDPVYCICHGSQYDPMVLAKTVNPKNGVEYVGLQRVHGPAGRSIPVVPVAARDDVLYGGMVDPRWYDYC